MRALLLLPLVLHPAIAQAARPPLPAPEFLPSALLPPVTPACISSPFGMRHAVGPHAPAAFHNGVDLPAPAGALVHAAADGTIAVIKRQGLGGVTIHLAHPDGTTTLYAHLGNLVPAIAEGRRAVKAGDALGHVARTGVTYGTHVFFAVLRGNAAIDPEPLLGVGRCGASAPSGRPSGPPSDQPSARPSPRTPPSPPPPA
jgi:murein DD-endopeptidase MepM/ murein hydrolase activator NlpD